MLDAPTGTPRATPFPMGHYPPRRLLPAHLARALADAHHRTGASYRQVARLLGIDFGYWRRLTMGERCPSREVAQRIATRLQLEPDVAEQLLAASVDPQSAR